MGNDLRERGRPMPVRRQAREPVFQLQPSGAVPKASTSPHFVQLYDADVTSLTRNVGRYLHEGWQRGDGLVVIAGSEHAAAFTAEMDRLGADTAAAARGGRLLVVDAEALLAGFMIDGRPDPELFRRAVTAALRSVSPDGGRIRGYGEMVGILWQSGETSAAMALEELWNGLMSEEQLELFCAYPIDVFGDSFHVAGIDQVLCAHTHLVPTGGEQRLESAVERAMADVLGSRAEGLRPLMKANYRPSWGVVPRGEAVILWLRNNLPDYAGEILSRARRYYRACA
jgi:hypothetical protein